MELVELAKYQRIAIAGGPHTGKTTLANELGCDRVTLHTDPDELPVAIRRMLEGLPKDERWSALSAEVVKALRGEPRFVVEGIRVAHALRKGLAADVVVWRQQVFPKPGHPRTPKHESTAQGVSKVFNEWRMMNQAGARIPVLMM